MIPKVSIIVPTYNRSNLLKRAVKSLLDQTYDNIEIIIIDDLSTDDTQEMVSSTFNKAIASKNLIYYRNEEKKERSTSRNKGLSLSTGVYISFLDDDDTFPNGLIRTLVDYLQTHPNVGCVFPEHIMVYEDGRQAKAVKNFSTYKGFTCRELCLLGVIGHISACFRKEICKSVGGFLDGMKLGENREFFARIALVSDIAYIPSVSFYQTVHVGSYSHISPREYAFSREEVWQIIEENIKRLGYTIRKEVFVRSYLNLGELFLPDISKASSYLEKAWQVDHASCLKSNAWGLIFRVLLGQRAYSLGKKMKTLLFRRNIDSFVKSTNSVTPSKVEVHKRLE
jgi:glycosyltransferase involved in cell wall biosynthesis